jgi:hypothetical protein
MGNVFRRKILSSAMPRVHRSLGNAIFTGLGLPLLDSPVRDLLCGLRTFQKDAIERSS